MPACDATKCPKLDNTVKAQVPKDCKDEDRPLAGLEALVLDAVGPLITLLELQHTGYLTPEAVAKAVTQALQFIGNASANMSVERSMLSRSYL